MVGELGPAVDGNFSVFRIQSNDDVIGEFQCDVTDEVWGADRFGSNDDEIDSGINIAFDGFQVTNAPANLNLHVRIGFAYGGNDIPVARRTGKCPIQIDQMQALRPCGHPATGHCHRVI